MLPVEYDAKAIKRLVDKTNNVFSSSNETLSESIRLLTTASSEGDATNAASIVTEATARADGDSAVATTVTALAASTLAADTANAASVVAAATAASSATSSLTNVVNAQRSLFGAAVSDTWDATKQYIGSTETIDSVDVATGEEAVKGGLVYRCRATHTDQEPPSVLYWDLVDTVDAVVSSAVLIESNTRASEDSALADSITALTARVGSAEQEGTDNAADIVTVNTVIADNKTAQSKRNDTLAARFGVTTADNYDNTFTYAVNDEVVYTSNVYRCILSSTGNLPTSTTYWALQELLQGLTDARIESLENTYATRSTALSSVIGTLTADVGANSVAITTTNTAFAAVDATLSQSIQNVITDLAETDATIDGEIVSFFQDSAPTGGHIGDIWFDTDDDNTIYTWKLNTTTNAYDWVATPNSAIAKAFQAALDGAAIADGKAKTFYSSDAPVNNTANNLGIGDLWVDEDTKELFRWTGTTWLSVRDTTLTQVIQAASDINDILDGQIVSFFQDSAPSSTHVGDFWFDTNDIVTIDGVSGAQPYVRLRDTNGDLQWETANNSALAKAFRDTSAAQDTADGKITAFYENEPPSTADSGDLWVDTNDGNKLYRWDASLSPPAWVSVQDGNIVTLLGKHGVNIDANGYIIGYDIFNDGTTGSFKIKADEFKIVEGSTANEAGTEVFSITNGVVTMGEAHIGSLSIGTEKIKDNAVSIPSGAFTAAEYYTNYAVTQQSGWQDVQSITFTQTANVSTEIFWSFLGKVKAGDPDSGDSGYGRIEVRILRGSSVVIDYGILHETQREWDNIQMVNGSLIDIPSTGGSATYTLQTKRTGDFAQVSKRSLITTELKK